MRQKPNLQATHPLTTNTAAEATEATNDLIRTFFTNAPPSGPNGVYNVRLVWPPAPPAEEPKPAKKGTKGKVQEADVPAPETPDEPATATLRIRFYALYPTAKRLAALDHRFAILPPQANYDD